MSQTMPKKPLQMETNAFEGNPSQSTSKIYMCLMALFTSIISTESVRKIGNYHHLSRIWAACCMMFKVLNVMKFS